MAAAGYDLRYKYLKSGSNRGGRAESSITASASEGTMSKSAPSIAEFGRSCLVLRPATRQFGGMGGLYGLEILDDVRDQRVVGDYVHGCE